MCQAEGSSRLCRVHSVRVGLRRCVWCGCVVQNRPAVLHLLGMCASRTSIVNVNKAVHEAGRVWKMGTTVCVVLQTCGLLTRMLRTASGHVRQRPKRAMLPCSCEQLNVVGAAQTL